MSPSAAHSSPTTALSGAELRLHRSLVRTFLANVPDAIYFKDLESRFIVVSKSKAARHGFENPDDLVGKSDFDFFAAAHAEQSRADEQAIIRTGVPILDKLEKIIWPDGQVTWSNSSKLPLYNDDGEIIGTFGISRDITQSKHMEAALEKAQKNLVEASRHAGMAEVATGVLHNVGNVLNSVNVSATVIASGLRNQKASSLGQLSALLHAHAANLGEFLTQDAKGRRIPEFIESLALHFASEQARLLRELESLQKNIDHIKDIVAMQQAYATTVSAAEAQDAHELMEDAVRVNTSAFARHDVQIVRDYQPVPPVHVEKGKVLQILVNLLRNAKHACDDGPAADKTIALRIAPAPDGRNVQLVVSDNGVGIPAENLTRIFAHGFTTRAYGHGFGLHSSALAAKDLKGQLTAHSQGPGRGATFTLTLPAVDSTAASPAA